MRLFAELENKVHLVRFEPGLIEFRPAEGVPRELANTLREKLMAWTGERWQVTISQEDGAPTLSEQERARTEARKARARETAPVRDVLEVFPDAEIREVHAGAAPRPDAHERERKR